MIKRIKDFKAEALLTSLLLLVLSFSSCNNRQAAKLNTDKATDVITKIDSITIYCDEGFRELIEQEVVIYERNYPDKHLNLSYLPETQVLKHLFEDSFATVIIGRKLHEQERDEILHRTGLQADEHTFATDAVAIIAGRDAANNTVPYTTILSLLNNTTHEFDLVFEGNGSSVINYMFAQIAHTSNRPSAYAAKNIDELADYLQKDKKAIGFIPFSRISDENDTTSRNLLKKVKLLNVSKIDSTERLITSTASQSEIADGSYPLDRPINLIEHSMDGKVGTGFVNFLYAEKSGRIILKAGLVPLIMPQRVINVNTDTIK